MIDPTDIAAPVFDDWPVEPGVGLRAAAIEDDGSCDADALLQDLVDRQRAAGRRVRGLVMTYPEGRQSCAGAMVLVDVHTGDAYQVSQPLGRESRACRADPQGFARASQVLRRALDEAPDLVVSNRFGGLEAEGGGFCAELLEVLVRDLPLLTVVPTRHLDAWRHFTGGATVLPARTESVQDWLAIHLGAETASMAGPPAAAQAAAR